MRSILATAVVIAIFALGAGTHAAERAADDAGTGCWPLAATSQAAAARSRASCAAPRGGQLRVDVEGVRSAHGVVLIGLYDSPASFDRAIELSDKDGFLNDPNRVAGAALRIDAASRSGVIFGNLQPGRYALIVIHDENANGRLDKNFFGIPTEPYGFSNRAQGFLGPPSFDDAAIVLGAHDTAAVVDLVYEGDRIEVLSPEEVVSPGSLQLRMATHGAQASAPLE